MSVFFCPSSGYLGDVIPFYRQGLHHAFYLRTPPPPLRTGAVGTPWAHLVSRDLVHWEEWPDAIAPGREGEPDSAGCWTGCVIEREGIFYLYYTGSVGRGRPQTVCLATSRDLRAWTKHPHNPIVVADPRWYEPNDWRDPFVFWNDQAGEYWMLLAARTLDGPANRRGCTALVASPDLATWEVREPIWSPRLFYTHECPDLFPWGDDLALVFSTFDPESATHYRLAPSLAGPWRAVGASVFDARACYAQKTDSDGQRRFSYGWIPTRAGETDAGAWEWAGVLTVHECVPQQGGGIGLNMLPELAACWPTPVAAGLQPVFGAWQERDSVYSADSPGGLAACLLAQMPDACRIEATIDCKEPPRACGLLLRADAGLDNCYQLRWEPDANRLVFDRSPKPRGEAFLLERTLPAGGSHTLHLNILVDGTAVVIYANDCVAFCNRAYDHRAGAVGLFVTDGAASFSAVRVSA
jgi:beta-fructofuranosidase